jgi:hypothetical protein
MLLLMHAVLDNMLVHTLCFHFFPLHEFYGVQFWFLILIGEKVTPIPTLYLISRHMGNSN